MMTIVIKQNFAKHLINKLSSVWKNLWVKKDTSGKEPRNHARDFQSDSQLLIAIRHLSLGDLPDSITFKGSVYTLSVKSVDPRVERFYTNDRGDIIRLYRDVVKKHQFMEHFDSNGNDLPINADGKTQSQIDKEDEEFRKRAQQLRKVLQKNSLLK